MHTKKARWTMTSPAYIKTRDTLRDAMSLWSAGKLEDQPAGEIVTACLDKLQSMLKGDQDED